MAVQVQSDGLVVGRDVLGHVLQQDHGLAVLGSINGGLKGGVVHISDPSCRVGNIDHDLFLIRVPVLSIPRKGNGLRFRSSEFMSRIRNVIIHHIFVVGGEPFFSINADDPPLRAWCQAQIAIGFIACFQLIRYWVTFSGVAVSLVFITYKLYRHFFQIAIADGSVTVSVCKACIFRYRMTTE